MKPNPTEEIKAIRHQLGADLDFDLHQIAEATRKEERESGRKYIRLPKREPLLTLKTAIAEKVRK